MGIAKYYLRKGTTDYDLLSFEKKEKGNDAISTVNFSISRSYDSEIGIGDDVSIGYYDGVTFIKDFAGDITKKGLNEELDCTIESYGGRLGRVLANEIYTDKSPEYIAEDLINTYVSSLTYASSYVSGITIERFVIKNRSVADAMKQLLELIDGQMRTDVDKNFYFELKGETTAGVVLTIGTNSWLESTWQETPNRMINDVTVIGDRATFNTSVTTNSTTSQTAISLSYEPVGNVFLSVDGVEQVGGKSGSVSAYDYTVDKELKSIDLENPLSNGQALVYSYEYEIPISLNRTNDDSITTYGRFAKKITNKNIKRMGDARDFAGQVIITYGEPVKNSTIGCAYDLDVSVGETVPVVDSFNGVNRDLVVNELTLKYPAGTKSLKVGVAEIDFLNWNQSIDDRLKKLEEADEDNTDVIQKSLNFVEKLNVSVKNVKTRVRTQGLGHATIVGSSTNGLVGSNTATQDGQQQVVGGGGRTYTVQRVVSTGNTFIENFDFDTYSSTANTSANWDTTNNYCYFDGSQTAESLAVYKNESTVLTGKVSTSGTSTTAINLYLSPDAGVTWESVTADTTHTFSATGTELRWRAVSSSTAYLENITIIYT